VHADGLLGIVHEPAAIRWQRHQFDRSAVHFLVRTSTPTKKVFYLAEHRSSANYWCRMGRSASGRTVGNERRDYWQAYQWMQTCVTQANSPLAPGSHTEPANYLGQPASNPSEASIAAEAFDRPWLQFVSTLPAMQDLTKEQLHQWQPDLAIECVPEQLSLKKRVLRQLSDLLPDKCIIASNSSYFVPSVLSQFVRLPERFAHLHFHVPVLRQSVADIVGCSQTRPEVLQQLRQLAERIEQYPLMLRHEHPGYVFNWLLQAVLKAALELVALDVVDSDDVDRSWKAVTGMQVGPFGMMDQIGLDVIDQVLSNARWAVPPTVSQEQLLAILRPLVEKGKLGIKSGAGFYDYQKPSS
jgi:hypothetical protein